jgi:TatA/E family protein of Tat protein translocase
MLSFPHLVVIFLIVLVVFGPQKLPELARGLGKLMAEFRKASTDFRFAFEEEMRAIEQQTREAARPPDLGNASSSASPEERAYLTAGTPEAGSGAPAPPAGESGAAESPVAAESPRGGSAPEAHEKAVRDER